MRLGATEKRIKSWYLSFKKDIFTVKKDVFTV